MKRKGLKAALVKISALGGELPNGNEVEVSIFGPGKGEAVAIHIGAGEWITVDSCKDPITGRSALLNYFDRIGLDVKSAVRLVVGTHAHDDHISGIAEVYAAAENASFVTSSAQTSEEFLARVVADEELSSQLRTSIRSEYKQVRDEVASRPILKGGPFALLHAHESKVLYEREATEDVISARVTSLTPSARAESRALEQLAENVAGTEKRYTTGDPNEFSIVLWIEVGDEAVLLGADLTKGPEQCGWKGVLLLPMPSKKASLFKIPHHGSENANHDEVWSDLLEPEPVALLTPFRRGVTFRPSDADVSRILKQTSRAYAAAPGKAPTTSVSQRKAAEPLGQLARNIRVPDGQLGHVRARRSTGEDEWRIELAGPARLLK